MKVFMTGASGLVGSATIPQLLAAGHQVTALSRSPKSDELLKAHGTLDIVRGSTTDLDVLKTAAGDADVVIHAAFNHEAVMSRPDGNAMACAEDRAAIEAMCEGLAANGDGKGKTFIYTSGTIFNLGAEEGSGTMRAEYLPRWKSEDMVLAYAKTGMRALVVRLPPVVHGPGHEHPFITLQIEGAKKFGSVGYVDEGKNVWCSTHVKDVGALLVLCVSEGETGYYHAVDEEGVPLIEIAGEIAKRMKLPMKSITPEFAMENYGWVGSVMPRGMVITAHKTKAATGWHPQEYGLLQELQNYTY